MKKKELIDLVNNDCLYSFHDVEDVLPECVQCVATNLEIDRHRWYSTCVNVYACEDGYVGIFGVNDLHSEGMDYSDCNCHCKASEYEEVTTIRFKNETLLLNNFFNIFHREIKHKTGVDIQKYIRTKKEEKKCTTVLNKQPKKKKSNKKSKFKDKEKLKLENWVNKKHPGKSKKEKQKMIDKIWYNRKNGNYSQNIITKKDFFI